MAKATDTKTAAKGSKLSKAAATSKVVPNAAKPTAEAQMVSSDSESDSDSDSDGSSGSDSEPEVEKRKNTTKPGVKKVEKTEPASPKVQDDTSEEESSDSDEEVVESNGQGSKKVTSANANGASKDSSSSSEESHEESEDSDEDMDDAPPPQTRLVNDAPSRAEEETTAKAVPARPFHPPPGYSLVDTKKSKATTLASALKNISSKQVWHITAPSSVPITSIQSISLSAIQTQQALLSHKGTDYTFAEEPATATKQKRVLIPNGNGYASVEVPVQKTLKLQQVMESVAEADTTASVGPVITHTPRPQPKGLRMRFKPSGFGEGDPGLLGSDSEAEPAAPTTKASERAKRKRAAELESPKKSKKARKEKDSDSKTHKTVDTLQDSIEVLNKPGSEKVAHKAEKALVEGTQKELPQTPEEKARRKEEKRKKKEAKKSDSK